MKTSHNFIFVLAMVCQITSCRSGGSTHKKLDHAPGFLVQKLGVFEKLMDKSTDSKSLESGRSIQSSNLNGVQQPSDSKSSESGGSMQSSKLDVGQQSSGSKPLESGRPMQPSNLDVGNELSRELLEKKLKYTSKLLTDLLISVRERYQVFLRRKQSQKEGVKEDLERLWRSFDQDLRRIFQDLQNINPFDVEYLFQILQNLDALRLEEFSKRLQSGDILEGVDHAEQDFNTSDLSIVPIEERDFNTGKLSTVSIEEQTFFIALCKICLVPFVKYLKGIITQDAFNSVVNSGKPELLQAFEGLFQQHFNESTRNLENSSRSNVRRGKGNLSALFGHGWMEAPLSGSF